MPLKGYNHYQYSIDKAFLNLFFYDPKYTSTKNVSVFVVLKLVEKFLSEAIFVHPDGQNQLADSQGNVLESQLYVGK